MRQIIKAIDIQVFFGKGESMSFKLIRDMKKHFKKTAHQPITINEFCEYFGIQPKEIIEVILKNEEERKQKWKKTVPPTENTQIPNTQLTVTPPQKPVTKRHIPYTFS